MDAVIQEQLPILEQVAAAHSSHDGVGNRGQNSDLSQTLRKRVSQACQPCARRKTKCDGALPTCTQCKQRDIQECTYAQSRRNKRTRRSSPSAFQRPSLGYDESSNLGGSPYASTERVDHGSHEYRFQQDGPRPGNQGTPSNQGFAALDALATSATARRSDSIQYKPMYDLTGLEYLADTMSQPLLYAIYSIAACVQPLYDASEDSYGDSPSPQQIFEAALAALQQQGPLNLLKTSIENCQALAILALQQHGVSEDTSAAMLCSLAASMALELRIHRSMPLGSDPSEVQIRSRLWWNIFVLDKMMACEMGRPVHLRWEEQDNSFPSTSESDEFQLLSLRLAGQNRVSSVKTHTISGFHTTIQITMLMERISRQIYSITGRTSISERSKEAAETRSRITQDLKDYGNMMDASPLKLDPNSSGVAAPVTITNIVWMWCLTILVHRPFINHQEAGDPNSPDPLLECVAAANNICHILEGYSDNLPMLSCDLIFPIFTTASTLSYWLRQDHSDEMEVRRQINLCIGWLRTLGKSWKNANSRQEILAKDFKASPGIQSGGHSPEPRVQQNGGVQEAQLMPEDWKFLNGFGDPTDEFYVMDANFRDMLQVPGLNI